MGASGAGISTKWSVVTSWSTARSTRFADWVARSGRPRYPGYLTYYVAKAGVVALTEALALELAVDQILVNAVAPGPIVAPEGTTAEEFATVERATPLGRWGGEMEIAKAVLALVESEPYTASLHSAACELREALRNLGAPAEGARAGCQKACSSPGHCLVWGCPNGETP